MESKNIITEFHYILCGDSLKKADFNTFTTKEVFNKAMTKEVFIPIFVLCIRIADRQFECKILIKMLDRNRN